MRIREMRIEDIGPIAEMESRDSTSVWDQTGLFTFFVRDDAVMLVADDNDDPQAEEEWSTSLVGFAGLLAAPPDADILDITVSGDRRNEGIGTQLFLKLLGAARDKGVDSVYLEVRVGNAPARHLYEKFGFEEIGYRKNYYTNPTEDAITMCRKYSVS